VRVNATNASFDGADLSYADFSHASLTKVQMTNANLFRTNLHSVIEEGASWRGSDRLLALATDEKRHAAETFSVG
jgi:uncharacterized protein YjbI with pentapeptide repeats